MRRCANVSGHPLVELRSVPRLRVRAGCELEPLSTADGSASMQLGTTQVLVAVYGPRPADGRAAYQNEAQLQANVTFAKFSGITSKPSKVPFPLVAALLGGGAHGVMHSPP
jgi:hypothetical protein